ncbi:MAG TPA: GlsB/YeaQ/YmgE family stress response membrane protein [Pseudonocardiaceae bacterium]|nr:GlsB/YeaQ/YmgE family stress response membrane protein [Pseudonocardiaceae bacterium]
MSILGYIVLGLIIGALAKLVMPGRDPGGVIITMVIGVVGAILGGLLGNLLFGIGLEGFFSLQTWLLALIGSLIVLAAYRALSGRRAVR